MENNIDKVQPTVEVALRGRIYKLTFDLAAACRAEQVTGKSIIDGSFFKNLGLREYMICLWAMAVTEEPNMTLLDLQKRFTLSDAGEVVAAVTKAIEKALPTKAEEKNAEVSQ